MNELPELPERKPRRLPIVVDTSSPEYRKRYEELMEKMYKPFGVAIVITHTDRGFECGIKSRMAETAYDSTADPCVFGTPLDAIDWVIARLTTMAEPIRTAYLPPPTSPPTVDED